MYNAIIQYSMKLVMHIEYYILFFLFNFFSSTFPTQTIYQNLCNRF